MKGVGNMQGDMYARDMGPLGSGVAGGSVRFGTNGVNHHTVFGPSGAGRFSWDTVPGGEVRNMHFTDAGYPKGHPMRHPFG